MGTDRRALLQIENRERVNRAHLTGPAPNVPATDADARLSLRIAEKAQGAGGGPTQNLVDGLASIEAAGGCRVAVNVQPDLRGEAKAALAHTISR